MTTLADGLAFIDLPQWAEWTAVALVMLILFFFLFGRRKASPQQTRGPVLVPEGETGPQGSFEKVDPQNRRAYPRRRGNPTLVFLSAAAGLEIPQMGLVVDRSEGGLCLDVEDGLVVGTVVNLRMVEADEKLPWVPSEVRHCRQEENGWKVGCRFLQSLPNHVRAQFG